MLSDAEKEREVQSAQEERRFVYRATRLVRVDSSSFIPTPFPLSFFD
jgi:hypothetical protein